MNLPQSTLHLPKTWWPAAAIIDPSFPMKLLGEQEKDNFAKLNPAQKARYRATGRGWKVERVGGLHPRFAATRERTHANLLQSVSSSHEEVLVRRKRRIGFRTSCAREASCACSNMAARGWIPPPYTEITCVEGGIVADVKLVLILIHDGSLFIVAFNWRRFVIVFYLKRGARNVIRIDF